jgi:hypothetical protein
VRWQQLFADLEAQLDETSATEFAAEVRDRGRREMSLVRLVDRLRPAVGQAIGIRVLGAGTVQGQLVSVGADWLLMAEAGGREALLPGHAVLGLSGLAAVSAVAHSEGAVAARLGFGYALRGIARDRAGVTIQLVDGSTLAGTVDRVGADFVELAEHPAGEPRRAAAVRGVKTVPLPAVAIVRTG